MDTRDLYTEHGRKENKHDGKNGEATNSKLGFCLVVELPRLKI